MAALLRFKRRSCSRSSYLGAGDTLSFVTSASSQDPTEPGGNDSLGTATPEPLPFSVNAYIWSISDIDYYKFTPPGSGTLSVNMTVPATKDYDIFLLNSSGAETGYEGTNGAGEPENLLAPVTGGNTYYLKVYGYEGWFDSSNTYHLEATLSQSDVTPPAISGVRATGVTSSGVTITWSTDEASDSQVNYGTTTSMGTFSALDTTLVTSHSVTLSGLAASTTYYYQVRSQDAAANKALGFTSSFTTSGSTTDPGDPGGNDSTATATPTSLPFVLDGYICTSSDVDYYTFTASGSGTISVNMTVPASVDFDVYLLDAAGNDTQYKGNQGAGIAESFAAPVTGGYTYYLKVFGFLGAFSSTDKYQLSASLSDTAAPIISAVTALNVTSTEATITWTTNEESDSQVTYGTTTNMGMQSPVDNNPDTNHSVTLSGLTASTTYYYRVWSKDAAGNLGTGDTLLFMTSAAADTAPPTISGVATSGITSSGVTITWTTNEASDTQVSYGTTNNIGTLSSLDSNLVTSHSVTLGGLTAGTTYLYQVRSRDAAGNLGTGATLSFATSPTADTTPPTISGVTTQNITSSGVTVTWTTNEAANTRLYYGLTTRMGTFSQLDTTLVSSHTVTLTGLMADRTYYYQPQSQDAAGNPGVGTVLTFRTLAIDTTPPAISGVAASNLTSNSVTITWTTNEASDSQVNYGTSSSLGTLSQLDSTPVTNHTVMLTGLRSGTTYYYQVRSKDATGNLATGTMMSFQPPRQPSFSISSPSAGESLAGVVPLSVIVTNPPSQLSQVVYSLGSQTIGTGHWSTTWDSKTAEAGTYSLSAVGTDSAGNTILTASPIQVTVTRQPWFTTPVSGSTITGGITLRASSNYPLIGAQFYLIKDGITTKLVDAAVNADGHSVEWVWAPTEMSGAATLRFVGFAAPDWEGYRAEVPVTMDVHPNVSIVSPSEGAEIAGAVTLTATAIAPPPTMIQVGFYLDGSLIGKALGPAYSVLWNTQSVSAGSHVLSVKGLDRHDNPVLAGNSIHITVPYQPVITFPGPSGSVNRPEFTLAATGNWELPGGQFYLVTGTTALKIADATLSPDRRTARAQWIPGLPNGATAVIRFVTWDPSWEHGFRTERTVTIDTTVGALDAMGWQVMRATSLFETSTLEGYGVLAHPDTEGFSWGVAQWNFGKGTLKPLLQSCDPYLDQADPILGPQLRQKLQNNTDYQLKVWANNLWPNTAERNKWMGYFRKLGSIQAVQAIQRQNWKENYYSGIFGAAIDLNLHSARGLAEVNDIAVQNGAMTGAEIQEFLGANWLQAEISRLRQPYMAEQQELLLLAKYVAQEKSNYHWGFNAWYRKAAIAANGSANGVCMCDVGFDDTPCDGRWWQYFTDAISYWVNPGVDVWEHDESGAPTNNLGPAESRGVNLRWTSGYYVIY